jgi:glutamate synthase (ferredoxin)
MLERIEDEAEEIRLAIRRHADYTGSHLAFRALALWEKMLPKFVRVMPRDYKRVISALREAEESGLSGDEALNAAFEANSTDVARIGGG